MYGQSDEMDKLVSMSKTGSSFDFYGVNDTRFMLDKKVYNAVQDEGDGYRSYLGTVEDDSGDLFVYPGKPFAQVLVESYDMPGADGYRLVDVKDGHVWLVIGTGNTDDYYPYFVFEYHPKEPE